MGLSWWHDWRGSACAIIASGPSAARAPIGLLKGRLPVLAIKENVRLCPWADVVYGCDGPWWHLKHGLPDYCGTKLCQDAGVCASYKDIHKVDVRQGGRILLDEPGVIGSGSCAGGNSGFQGINLAVQFGARRILLIGFDMHAQNGVHWYGRNVGRMMNNPRDDNFLNWREALDKQSLVLRAMAIDVVNCSPDSALVCFEKKDVATALLAWGL